MNTKKFFMLLAAMLLGSASASAYNKKTHVNGIYYELYGLAEGPERYAVVIKNPDKEYTGAVYIPASITTDAYYGSGWLEEYPVTKIASNAFQGCTGLTSITIPKSVTEISGATAFSGCISMTSINVKDGNTVYDSRNGCNAIIETATNCLIVGCKNTVIPNSVTSIRYCAFEDCTSLTSITIPNSVTSIGESAFSGCSGLTSVTIGSGVTSIGNSAFSGCSSLTSVTIPNSVTSIGRSAFYECYGLTSITIPNSVTSIGSFAFEWCSGLTKAEFASIESLCSIPFYDYYSNPLFYAHHLYIDGKEVKDLVIPNSVTSIGQYAFYHCSGLTSITIPNSVTSIGNDAFAYCPGLTDVYCYAENVPNTESYAFRGSNIASATLYVPATSLEAYRTTAPWSGFGNIVAIDGRIIEDLSELSNNRQYLIHTRDESRGSLGVTEKHLASTNPAAYGPWVCRPVVLDTDNPLITNLSQLSSPYTEPTEGSLAAMIDSDPETFWHSVWSQGAVEAGSHYFQVEMLNQANIDVAFKVIRRQTGDNHITEWGVYGTNNANATKAGCTQIAVIETPYNGWGETRVSDIFKTGGYKYLRFYINNNTTGRGFGHLAEFQLYPATTDEEYGDASPFAIIQKNGGYYLYSVLDKAFITPVNDGDENANPLLPNDNKMNIDQRDGHFVFSFVETNYTINVNQKGVVINDYGKMNDEYDDGNLFTIEEVGNFDPTEALAKFETQIFTVTYNVIFDGKVVATATEEVASGSPLPPAPASLDNGFVTLTKTGTHPTTVTGDVTVTYNATWNGPFEFTKTAASAKWYNLHIRSGYYVGKQNTEPYYPTKDVDEATLATPAYQWAFDGDPYHVKVYNRTTGLNETLTKDGDNAVMRSGDYTWDLLPNIGGFVLRVTGTEYSCINHYGSTSGPLKFWTNSKALTDDGSTFRVEEVVELSPAIEFADANVKALCVAKWDTNGDGELSEEEAAAVTSLGNVFNGKTNITSFNELQYFTGLTSIGNNAFYGCSKLNSITIPQSVTSIGEDAFWACSNLIDVWCYAEIVPATSSNAFRSASGDSSCVGSATLHVPAASLNAYSTTAPWSSFGMIVPINGFVINDETTSFSIAAEESGKAVVLTHQFTGEWESLYLPFAIDYDAIKADFDLAEIDGVVQNDDDNDGIADFTVLSIMGFKEQMTEPNTPYLIRAKNAGEQTIVFDDVTVYPTEAATFECSSFSKRYEFTGSYNTLGASALANRYVVQGGELVKGASSLAPCRWYMTAISKTGGALNLPARIRIMPVEDVIDGIETLSDSPLKGEDIYNLAGQRLQKMQKGINIMNGKKILR